MSLSEEPDTKGGTLSTKRKRVQRKIALLPVPSYRSMKSDHSMDRPFEFRREVTRVQRLLQSLQSCSLEETSSEKLSFTRQVSFFQLFCVLFVL
uniref:Uncharacterized protein n=1 Tax=Anguilla anguilla TaxID=7936 RepID=A0A0E9XZI5_ANGAN